MTLESVAFGRESRSVGVTDATRLEVGYPAHIGDRPAFRYSQTQSAYGFSGGNVSVFSVARSAVQGFANRRGYQVERAYELGEYRLNVLDLVVDRLGPSRDDFFFFEVGANDGIADDQIYEMVRKYGWRGILLEPQSDVFTELVANYTGFEDELIFENAALAATDGETDFWTIPGQSGLGSFDRSILHRKGFSASQIKLTRVPTISVPTLLQRHQVETVDLLQIDTEGYDFEVIKMFIDATVLPSVINYEHLHLSDADRRECVSRLGHHGYRMLQAGPYRRDTVAYRQSASIS